jgi:hypothetical protein
LGGRRGADGVPRVEFGKHNGELSSARAYEESVQMVHQGRHWCGKVEWRGEFDEDIPEPGRFSWVGVAYGFSVQKRESTGNRANGPPKFAFPLRIRGGIGRSGQRKVKVQAVTVFGHGFSHEG